MLISLNANIPRYFIKGYLGEAELGRFSSMAYFLVGGITIIAALGQTALPRLAKLHMALDVLRLKALILRLLLFGMALGFGGIFAAALCGEPILYILYGKEFTENSNVLTLIMVAGGLSYMSSLLGFSMTAFRQYKVQMILFFTVTCSTIILCNFLIKPYGLAGAGYAMIISNCVQLLFSFVIVLRTLAKMNNSAKIIQ
jgi:O-antigen/teichoic acid export membrane protein